MVADRRGLPSNSNTVIEGLAFRTIVSLKDLFDSRVVCLILYSGSGGVLVMEKGGQKK